MCSFLLYGKIKNSLIFDKASFYKAAFEVNLDVCPSINLQINVGRRKSDSIAAATGSMTFCYCLEMRLSAFISGTHNKHAVALLIAWVTSKGRPAITQATVP